MATPVHPPNGRPPQPPPLTHGQREVTSRDKMFTLVNRRIALLEAGFTPENNGELASLESWYASMVSKSQTQRPVAQQTALAASQQHPHPANGTTPAVNPALSPVHDMNPPSQNGLTSKGPDASTFAASNHHIVPPTSPIDLSTSPGLTLAPEQQMMLKSQILAYKSLSKNLPLDPRVARALFTPNEASSLWSNGGAGEGIRQDIDNAEPREWQAVVESARASGHSDSKQKGVDPADDDPSIDARSLAYPYNAYTHPRALRDVTKNTVVPALLPPGLDPYALKEAREKYIQGRMQWRLGELQSMSSQLGSSMPSPGRPRSSVDVPGQKLKALIELKGLQLLHRQKALRTAVLDGLNQSTTLTLAPDRSAFRRVRKPLLREARATERLEREQKKAREQRAKQRHLDHLGSVARHAAGFKAAHEAQSEKIRKLGRNILRFHAEAEKEEQRRIERLTKERLKALKADDEEGYLKLIDKTKDTRITHLLRQTDAYLDSLSQAVQEQQKEAQHRDGAIVFTGPVQSQHIDESAFGAVPVFEDDKAADSGKADYYNVAHRIKEEVHKQSSLLIGGQLKEYQIKGLQWMVSLYNNRLNGILADEMGLGKTIQTISLITYLMEHKRQRGPYLVIVPLSTMPNWTLEFEKWAPAVSVVCYKGSPTVRKQMQATQLRSPNFQVLLTTYEYVIKDRPALSKIKWVHMIIDEGHRMKNANSKLSVTLTTFYFSRHRLILTGTPLQNNLPELWALLNFVLPKVFNSVKSFDEWFNTPFANTGGQDKIELNEEEAILVIRRLHKVLRPFLLRRLKKDVESELPDKVERVIKCKMSALQTKLTHMLKTHKVIFTETSEEKGGDSKKGLKGLQNVIMQLKKLCNHPFAFEEVETTVNGPYKPTNDTLWRSAGKFELLDRILPKLFSTGHRVLMFFQMTQIMDIFQDYCSYRSIKNLRLDGTTKPEERADLLKIFNSPTCDVHLFLLSTRAGGLGLNLQTADTVIIFDSDWNPHQDLQAQDRAHRIGQKKEVRVLRLITSKSVEEHIMSKAQFKLDMDKKVIQAGRFDNKSSAEEREMFLRELLEDDDNDEEGDNELGDEELNDILARGDHERAIFAEMDKTRAADELKAWRATPQGKSGKPVPERLMTLEELPKVYVREHAVIPKKSLGADEDEAGIRKPRVRTAVHYDDGLTEEQFVAALESETTDLHAVIDAKRKRKAVRRANKVKNGLVDSEEDEDDSASAASSEAVSKATGRGRNESSKGRGSVAQSPEPNMVVKKRKRGSAVVSAEVSVEDEDDVRPKVKKRNVDDGLNGIRRVMRECYDHLMRPADEAGHRRISLFMELVNRKMLPDYYQIIKKPISMKQIHKGIQTKYRFMQQFRDDVHLMFNNARIYNETGSYVYIQAEELQLEFDEIYHRLVGEDGVPRTEALPAQIRKRKQVVESSDGEVQGAGSSSSDNEDEN